jgi:exodeoxyribonuclease V alpha subunit
MVIEFDGRAVTYGFRELDEVVLAYATTVHKSQAPSTRLYGSDPR